MKYIGIGAVAILLIVFQGLIATILWGWFAVPLGAPPINPALAIGLTLLVNRFISVPVKPWKTMEDFYTALLTSIVSGLLALAVGYVIHLFV